MEFESRYISKKPDAKGNVEYTTEENEVWSTLYHRQVEIVRGRACPEWLQGLEDLRLPHDVVPQLPYVSQQLMAATGWQVVPVPALITAKNFFELLASKQFPAATFIRSREELEYVQEPDIFHELFGHCPMLMVPVFADFVNEYSIKVLNFPESEWALLQRMFWFTVEFGLLQTSEGVRAYGGGILSSIGETVYAVESDIPERRPFSAIDIFRTPYRIDMKQSIYYVLDNLQQLFHLLDEDLPGLLKLAHTLKEFPPTFPVEKDNPSIHINWC